MNILKRIKLILLTFMLCISSSIVLASNSIGLVNVAELSFREKASSSSTELFVLEYGQPVTITGSASDKWYSATIYNNNHQVNGYVYKSSIKIYTTDNSFESSISSFPDSYKQALRYVHCLNPNWKFQILNTNLDFNTAASGFQSKALVDGTDTALRENNTVLEGSNWYRANLDTTKYFLDPSNFLIASRILMFEKLSYDASQTLVQVQDTLKNTYMASLQSGDTKTFAQMFYEAGQTYNVSPIYLAVRALQEQGTTGTGGLGSQGGTIDGTVYYNIFNIGATSGAQAGIEYAKSKGWTTREASIKGGAEYIAKDYINAKQDSIYLQRFNVHPDNRSKVYSHSYMTNIRAPYSEAFKTCETYLNNNIISTTRTFVIPVYTNKSATTYPGTMNRLTIDASASLPSASSPADNNSSGNNSSPAASVTYAKGDVDGGGSVSAVDYVLIKNHIMGSGTLTGDKLSRADVNGDGSVSAVDYVLIKNHIMGVSLLS